MARTEDEENTRRWLLNTSLERMKQSRDSDARQRYFLKKSIERIRASRRLIARTDRLIRQLWNRDSL